MSDLTTEQRQALAELTAHLAHIREALRVLSPDALRKVDVLMLYMTGDPVELMKLVDGISEVSRRSPEWQETMSSLKELLPVLKQLVEERRASDRTWETAAKWAGRAGVVRSLVAAGVGALAALAWAKGIIVWPPPP